MRLHHRIQKQWWVCVALFLMIGGIAGNEVNLFAKTENETASATDNNETQHTEVDPFPPGVANSALQNASAVIDCNSSVRDPNVPYEQYLRNIAAACATKAGNVFDVRTAMSNTTFENVPVWTDAEIEWYFKYTRDAQYLVDSERPNCTFLRRISWQYPYMGCQQRAEQANGLIADTGKQKPYKLFAFGELHVITDNHPNGYVDWAWHVVPVVRRSTGEPIVFDAAINPCRPLNWKEWLAQMTMDINNFDDVAGGWGVTVANANAYTNMSDPVNEPSHREDSKFDLQNAILDWEWHVQETLLRDPNEVLNTNPPWANKACEKIVMNSQRIDVKPNTNITIVTRCPFGTLVLGGGFVPYADTFLIYKNARNGNGWEISARNTSTSSQGLFVDVDCLVDPPSNAFVSTVTSSKVTIARNAYNSATASCSSGKLIGGGFLTTLGNPAAIMKIYNHGRTTSKGNTWRVSAYNTTTGSRNLTSYAYCLQNANVSVTQTSANVTGSDGYAIATCPSSQLTMGGGFTFPRTAAYSVLRMWNNLDNTYRVQFYPFPTGGNAANSYSCAQCMTKP